MALNNQSGITYYRQIADIITNRILNGVYKLGEQIPPGRELGKEFRCNRHTIRRALDLVENEELIVRQRGRGTFVVSELPKSEKKTQLTIGLIDISHALGSRPASELLTATIRPAGEMGFRLGISETDDVIYIHRLRLIKKSPAIVEFIYIPHALTPTLMDYDLSASLRTLMAEKFDLHLVRNEVIFESVLSSAYESELLEIPISSAMMLEKRKSFSKNDTIIEYSEHIYRGDQFSFLFK